MILESLLLTISLACAVKAGRLLTVRPPRLRSQPHARRAVAPVTL